MGASQILVFVGRCGLLYRFWTERSRRAIGCYMGGCCLCRYFHVGRRCRRIQLLRGGHFGNYNQVYGFHRAVIRHCWVWLVDQQFCV